MLRTSNTDVKAIKNRSGCAGTDNEAPWSCKERVTEDFHENASIWTQNQEYRVSIFWMSRRLTDSRGRPITAPPDQKKKYAGFSLTGRLL